MCRNRNPDTHQLEQELTQSASPIRVFAYAIDENVRLHRAIMRAFMEAKERFIFHLRLPDLVDALQISGIEESPTTAAIDSALARLCEWGNLQPRPDTTDANTLGDFLKQRHAFQLTDQGEAAERALELFDATSLRRRPPQITALAQIRYVLQQLEETPPADEFEVVKFRARVLMLEAQFEDLTASVQTLIRTLETAIEQPLFDAAEAQHLIGYAERFAGNLLISGDSIAKSIRNVEAAGLERMLYAAVDKNAGACQETRSRWWRFRNWFISRPDCIANAEIARERLRASITKLLSSMTRMRDRRLHRIDAPAQFRILARSFAKAASDAEAHRLWRSAFGLSPARHLLVNDRTLDDHEKYDVPPNTSWLEAPPLRMPTALRHTANHIQPAFSSRIVDRTEEKRKLAAAAHEEALSILKAQKRFGAGRIRLSQLEHLESDEFDVLLDLLGEALSAKVSSSEAVEILSSNGSLKVCLEPTGDDRDAMILTSGGMFFGPDHWIRVEETSKPEMQQC
jgi:uncharacterized protein (TIGR02677 family)